MSQQKNIEIELRSLFDQATYERVKGFLDDNARDLGEDDKDVHFFLLPDRIAKVVHNISKKSAKLVVKLNRLGSGTSDFEEIEVSIAPEDVDKAVQLFTALPFDQVQNSFQKRHNYEYKGVEIAMKYTDSWGYHMELEIVVDDISQKAEVEQKIQAVAEELGVKIMSEEELTTFAQNIDKQYTQKGVFQKK